MKKYFNNFLKKSAFIVLAMSAFFSLVTPALIVELPRSLLLSIVSGVIVLVLCVMSVIVYRKNLYNIKKSLGSMFDRNILVHIIVFSFLIRLIWILLIPSTPSSDFALMFNSGALAAKGNYDIFHGTAYFARFAHDTVTVLYFSLLHRIMENPLFLAKFLNVIYQTAAVYLVYLIVEEIFKDKRQAKISAFLMSVFPPFIMYTSQTMSENMALPLYLLSVYFFFKGLKKCTAHGNIYLFLSGIFLSFANLFRMVGIVFLIAYVVYLLLYRSFKETLIKVLPLVISYALLLFITSSVLLSSNITETHLWASKEPSITSVLKGTNIESFGRWNPKDAELPEKLNFDSIKIKEEALKIIKDRLTKTPIYKLFAFYIIKISSQWGFSEYNAYSWTIPTSLNNPITALLKQQQIAFMVFCNFIFYFILFRAYKTLSEKERNLPDELYFFIILFGGFVLLFLLTEMQSRYSFIAAWILIILGVSSSSHKIITDNSKV